MTTTVDPKDALDLKDARDPRRCRATSSTTGNPCGRWSIPGGTVCKHHGGAAGQVRRKAALRLLELVEPAIARLKEEMDTAEKSADRLRAADSILDRAGVVRGVAVDVDTARALLIRRLMELRGEPDVVEGVLVEADESGD